MGLKLNLIPVPLVVTLATGMKYDNLPVIWLSLQIKRKLYNFAIIQTKKEFGNCLLVTTMWIYPVSRAYFRIPTVPSCVVSEFQKNPAKDGLCTQILVPWERLYSVIEIRMEYRQNRRLTAYENFAADIENMMIENQIICNAPRI